jgi:flagellar basal-body rod modification protein FlgD
LVEKKTEASSRQGEKAMNIQGLPIMTPGLATFQPNAAKSANTSSSATSGSSLNPNDAESTFMKMLVTELQSQDPTQPMDPMQMVGQMFSMNQLQQLIDINQTLSAALGGVPTGSFATSAAAASTTGASQLQGMNMPSNVAASYAQQLMTGAH